MKRDFHRGNIIGIIDSNGAVFSRFFNDLSHTHDEFWPTIQHNRWRWNDRDSIHFFVTERGIKNPEDYDKIQTHLTKKYRIKWLDNGYHDISHLVA